MFQRRIKNPVHSENEERLQALISGISEAIWETDPKGKVVVDSPSWRQSTGQSVKDWLDNRWLDMIHPDDREVMVEGWKSALINRTSQKLQCRIFSADGFWRWTGLCLVPIFHDTGKLKKWVVLNQDISQSKAAEIALEEDLKAMHKLHEVSLEMIVEGDSRKLFDKILAAAVELTHSDASILRVVNPLSNEITVAAHRGVDDCYLQSESKIQACFDKILSGRQNRKRLIVANVKKSQILTDEVRNVLLECGALSAQTTPLVSRSGRILGFISTHWKKVYVPSANEMKQLDLLARQAADLIERNDVQVALKQSESKLKEALTAAQSANEAKTIFLARMSHEIRTPMTAIIGFLELLDSTPLKPRQQRYVKTVRQNAENLLDIINDILDISKVEAGELSIEKDKFDFFAMLEDTVSLMKIRAGQKRLPLYLNAKGQLPKQVTADKGRLRQILLNLIGNAIKFTDRGRVDVQVWFEKSNTHGNLHFAVSDTGLGINPEFFDKIFCAFSQDSQSAKKVPGGTGLGLSICKSLVEAMGGEISFKSVPGQGTTFNFFLPIHQYAELSKYCTDAQIGEIHPEWSSGSALSQWHVLMVDDTAEMRELARVFLERSGARVTTANDGKEAIDTLHRLVGGNDAPDLILMDMQMPELDGYETTRLIRSEGFEIPILALTAAAMKGDQEKCLRAGCNGYLSKPLNLTTLQQQVVQFGRLNESLH